MLKCILFILTLNLTWVSFSNKNRTLSGFCFEAGTKKGASFTKIKIYYRYDTVPDEFTTIGDGSFEITLRPNENSYYLVLSNYGYIPKTIYNGDIETSENLMFYLRKRMNSFGKSDIDSSIIGIINKGLLARFHLDESDIQRISHMPLKTSLFKFELGDGTKVTILHENIMFNKKRQNDWAKLKIIGYELQASENPEIAVLYNREKENKEVQQEKLRQVKRIELIELKPYCYEDVVKSDSINPKRKVLRCYAESIIETDSKNDSTYLNWKQIGARVELNPRDYETLFKSIFEADFENYISVCYEPRHGVLFYNANNELIGYVEICFQCSRFNDIGFNLGYMTPSAKTIKTVLELFIKAGFVIKNEKD